jgi:hypothetical protein
MSKSYLSRGICAALFVSALSVWLPTPVDATHSYSGHWRRTSSGIRKIPVLRMLSSTWVPRYTTAMTDWSKPAMTKIKPYTYRTYAQNAKCPHYSGYISVCNGNYGGTGWGGLALLWTDYYGHAIYGWALQNDYYFSGSSATNTAWRQHIICQEIGHVFGLGHVNEIVTNANTGSCMDYTNDPDGGSGGYPGDKNNMHPNSHDYAFINARHNHVGRLLPGFAPAEADLAREMLETTQQFDVRTMRGFGRLVFSAKDGVADRYELNLPSGARVTTWAIKGPAVLLN